MAICITGKSLVKIVVLDGKLEENLKLQLYCLDPKFDDRQVWPNSVDPDQTAPEVGHLVPSSDTQAHIKLLVTLGTLKAISLCVYICDEAI